jgi:hypothetical protein
MPNPWDAGSARLLAGLGYEALATSSGASAGVLGKRDGEVTRDEALAHVRAIAGATDLPLSADLERGFGDAPADAAETIRLGCARRRRRCGRAGRSGIWTGCSPRSYAGADAGGRNLPVSRCAG